MSPTVDTDPPYSPTPGDPRAMTTAERFAALVAAYGAEPARWPEAERAAARRFAAAHPQTAGPLLAEARALDGALEAAVAAAPTPVLSPAARAALLADARPRRSPVARLMQGWRAWFGVDWRPAGALATAVALGLLSGAAAPALPPFIAAEAVAADPAVEALEADAALYLYGPADALDPSDVGGPERPGDLNDQTEAAR